MFGDSELISMIVNPCTAVPERTKDPKDEKS